MTTHLSGFKLGVIVSRVSQKDAVYEISMRVLEENRINFDEGVDILTDVIDRDIRSSIVSIIVENFEQDNIVSNKNHIGEKLRSYSSGLVSNWAKKDLRLNGNIEHTIKNPGSKVNSTDPIVRELRKMLKEVKGTEHESAVGAELRIRLESLRKEQSKSITINASLIPESLRHLIQ